MLTPSFHKSQSTGVQVKRRNTQTALWSSKVILLLQGGKVVKKRDTHGTVWRTAIMLTTTRGCTSPSMSRRLRLRLLTWPGVALFWNSSAANTQYAHSFARADACGSTNSSLLKDTVLFSVTNWQEPISVSFISQTALPCILGLFNPLVLEVNYSQESESSVNTMVA